MQILLELQVHGFSDSKNGRDESIDGMIEYDRKDISLDSGSVKMNGSSDYVISRSTPKNLSVSGCRYRRAHNNRCLYEPSCRAAASLANHQIRSFPLSQAFLLFSLHFPSLQIPRSLFLLQNPSSFPLPHGRRFVLLRRR